MRCDGISDVPSGGERVERAVRGCLATAIEVNHQLGDALAIADDMLGEARSLGVSDAVDDIAAVVENLELVIERMRGFPPRLNDLLAQSVDASAKPSGESTTTRPPVNDRDKSPSGQEDGAASARARAPAVIKPGIVDGLTLLTRAPDPEAVAPGTADVARRSGAEFQEDLEFQHRTADQLAQAGFAITQLERDPHQVSPDYSLEGRRFDCFTPRSGTTPDSIRRTLRGKMKKGQAFRFVVNMDRSEYNADDLRRRLARSSSSRLMEVIVVKNRTIEWVWPQN